MAMFKVGTKVRQKSKYPVPSNKGRKGVVIAARKDPFVSYDVEMENGDVLEFHSGELKQIKRGKVF